MKPRLRRDAGGSPELREITRDVVSQHYNLRVVQPMLTYVLEHYGLDSLDVLASAAELRVSDLRSRDRWVSAWQFEQVVEAARALMKDDSEFRTSFAYKLTETYGPLLMILRTMSVRRGYTIMAQTSHMVMRQSRFEVVESSRTSITLRYVSEYRESALMCMSRESSIAAVPTLWWNVPRARIDVLKSFAKGDDECLYKLAWYEPLRLRGPLAGMALGGVTAALLPAAVLGGPMAAVLLPLLGGAIGATLEYRRMISDKSSVQEEMRTELEELLQGQMSAVREVFQLQERAQRWSELQEHRFEAQSVAMEELFNAIQKLANTRVTELQSLSHDLRNPMAVIRTVGQLLRSQVDSDDRGELVSLLDDLDEGVVRLEALLEEMVQAGGRGVRPLGDALKTVQVPELAQRLERQLRAMVLGRDIRVSVLRTRECPDKLVTQPLMFDRLVDNLLTNAAKYTERGSILVELDGNPGHLTLKISDTGRGISSERLARVFKGGEPDANPVVGTSHGIGLTNVVRLLDQLQGRLEVLSRPEQGTTFWVYVPVEPPGAEPDRLRTSESIDEVVERVVHIRKAQA